MFVKCVKQLRKLYQWLPRRFTLNQPKLIFSTSEHGTSLSTFFTKVSGHEPTFIVIRTDQSEVSNICFSVLCNVETIAHYCRPRNALEEVLGTVYS